MLGLTFVIALQTIHPYKGGGGEGRYNSEHRKYELTFYFSMSR